MIILDNILSQYTGDAWQRRAARDFTRMPTGMKVAFLVRHLAYKAETFIAIPLLFAALIGLFFIVKGTWLVGGDELISNSSAWIPTALLYLCSVIFRWIFPFLCNLIFTLWYESTRSSFKAHSIS